MGILDEDIQRVREATDIVAVVSEHLQLKRVGRRWVGLCPFHGEKSPSFSVNQEEGLYYCFGCRASGDVITFVREIEKLDFVGAVEKLAGKAGVPLRYTEAGEGEKRQRRTALYDAVARAVDWYHERLLSADDAARARAYLRSRGLGGDEVRRFRIGWAPEGWDELAKALRVPDDVWTDSGLGFLNRSTRQTDAFRGRVLFPIFDVEGRPVAFGGRVLPGGEGPKYKNSAESRIYAKSKVLYALNWMKAEIVTADEVIVCEGYTDVIGFAKAGLPRAVATCGTALTEEHFRLLKRFAGRVVLAFDADSAGQNAAAAVYEWERQYEIDVAVAALPTGIDPGELANDDPAALRSAVETAAPFLQFRLNRVLDSARLDTPEQRVRAAEAAMAVVREHPSAALRDQYLLEVASRTRVDPDRLRTGDHGGVSERGKMLPVSRRGNDARRSGRIDEREGPEVEALRLLVSHREDIEEWLHDDLFGDGLVLSAYRALRDHRTVLAAVDHTDPAAAELLQRVAMEESEAEPLDVVDLLLTEAGTRSLREIDARVQVADDPLAFAREMAWLKLAIEDLRSEHPSADAREQLLAWLTQHPEDE